MKGKNVRSSKTGRYVEPSLGETDKDGTVSEPRKPRRTFSATELALKKAIKGLVYTSETDAPFEVMTETHLPLGIFKTIDFDRFFAPYFDEVEDKKEAQKYADLRDLLKQELTDLQVVKISRSDVEFDIFIFGRDAHYGTFSGLKTFCVDT